MSEFGDAVNQYLADRTFQRSETAQQKQQHQIDSCQELLTTVGARELLEEVNEFWNGIGTVEPTRFGLSLVYSFPDAASPSSPYPPSIEHRFISDKAYASDTTTGFEIRPYRHNRFDRFDEGLCIRVARVISPFTLEIHGIIEPELAECRFDVKSLLLSPSSTFKPSPYSPDCIYPNDDSRDKLKDRLVSFSAEDKLQETLPWQREAQAQRRLQYLEAKGLLYPTREDLFKAARAETEEAKAQAEITHS